MKILSSNQDVDKKLKKNTVITVGNFDGVHKGHQKIIKECIKLSKRKKLFSVVVTFDPHPKEYFNNKAEPFKLTSDETKINEIKTLGVDFIVLLKFDNYLNKLSPEDFIKKIIIKKLKAKYIVVGYNFHFGYKRRGNINVLKKLSTKYGYSLLAIKPIVSKKGETYNSSIIRNNLKSGKYNKVKEMLGRKWQIIGKVKRGSGRGQVIGYPTANISLKNYIIPLKGVYATESYFKENKKKKKKYSGIANIGNRPTFNGKGVLMENYFFDIKKNFYGKKIYINLLQFLRKEKKFKNMDKLKEQIELDIKTAKIILKKDN